MTTIEEQVPGLSGAELDAFPHGIIRLDSTGTIVYYNQALSLISGLPAAQTVGRNFFRDVAPCSAVRNFQGRFNDFVATTGSRIEQFGFLFHFSWGDKAVQITFVRAQDQDRVFICVNATSPPPPGAGAVPTAA